MPTARIARLKEETLARVSDRHLDRARLVTESYKATERQPICIRRAKAIGRFIEKAPIQVFGQELLVGDRSWVQPYEWNYPDQRPKAKPNAGECECAREIDDIWSYWLDDRMPTPVGAGSKGHCVPGFQHLLRLGFNGLAEKAAERLARLDPAEPNADAKRDYLRSQIMLAKSCARIGQRFARLAAGLAESETGQRRRELLDIAVVCRQVPAKPPRNFREAVQALWFGELLIEAEDSPNGQSPGRVDQLLFPHYEQDLAIGQLTREDAKELLSCLWLKLWAPYDVHDTVIAGLTPDGRDASNELSELIVDVQRDVGLRRQLSLRYHRDINPRLFAKVCDSLRDGLGVPQIFNDDVLVPALTDCWLPVEAARSYSIIGCIEMTVPGEGDGRAVASYTNLPECLEWVLHNGECPVAGKLMGLRTGDPLTIRDYDDLWQRYQTQVRHVLNAVVTSRPKLERAESETFPMVMLSMLTEDCIENATDITAGGARYNSTMFCAVGVPNVADSLAALKKLVFDERRVSLQELLSALRNNFEGAEGLRRMLLTEAPKYGNDEDEVDRIAYLVGKDYCDALAGLTDPRGGPFRPSYFSFTACVGMGKMVAATSDGRKATAPLANSLCAPQGNMRRGPTALLKSAGKLHQRLATGGTSMLLDLHPSMVQKTNGHDPLAAMLKTYFDLGGSHIEVSLIDAKTLRRAQQQPDQHQDLTVRVAGYSAQFTSLSRELQDHVIERLQREGAQEHA